MFKNKGVKTIKKPYVVEPKIVNPLDHIVDVNMVITRSKVTEKEMFKDKNQSRISLLLIGKRSTNYNLHTPKLLMDPTTSPKVKTMEGGVGARSLTCNTLGVEG
jgi:hypothetical protein